MLQNNLRKKQLIKKKKSKGVSVNKSETSADVPESSAKTGGVAAASVSVAAGTVSAPDKDKEPVQGMFKFKGVSLYCSPVVKGASSEAFVAAAAGQKQQSGGGGGGGSSFPRAKPRKMSSYLQKIQQKGKYQLLH